jgi:hypothetical protein
MKSRRGSALVVAVIALAPLALVVVLRLPTLNQLDYADAWFYSAYAWSPRHHLSVYNWNYFSVRFPTILFIRAFENAFGADAGYLVLRYVLAVGSGGAVYLAVRRIGTRGIGCAAVLILYLHPYFSRMLLWDYTGFVVVSAGVIGVSLWWWSDGRAVAWSFLPGVALAIAVYANVIIVMSLAVLFTVEIVAAMRTGRSAVETLLKRFGVIAMSAVLVLAVGDVSYLHYTSVTPDDLLRPTLNFLRSNDENSSQYVRPVSEWLPHELRIWAPVLVSIALVAVLRRRMLGVDLSARIAQACVAYIAFIWVYRFAVTSSVVETWWAYDFGIVVMAPAVGVLLHALSTRSSRRSTALVVVGGTTVSAVLIRTIDGPAIDLYNAITSRPWLMLGVLMLGVGLAVAITVRWSTFAVAALAGFALLTTFVSWAPSVMDDRGTTGEFVRDADLEWDAYNGARRLVRLVADYDSPARRVYTWYPDPRGPESIGWTTLPQLGQTVHVIGSPAQMKTLEPLGRSRLLQADAAYVLAISERVEDVANARHALEAAGFAVRQVSAGTLADARLRYSLLALVGKPAA